jgi:hypothetical protein
LGDLGAVIGFNFKGHDFLGYLMPKHCLVRLSGNKIGASQRNRHENEQQQVKKCLGARVRASEDRQGIEVQANEQGRDYGGSKEDDAHNAEDHDCENYGIQSFQLHMSVVKTWLVRLPGEDRVPHVAQARPRAREPLMGE